MGHQLLLTSCIPHNNYTQTVATLQALTGSRNPQPIATYTILTKPRNVFKPKFEPGKVNQIEQFYMKCTTIWNDDASKNLDIAAPVMPGTSDINVDRLFSGKEVKHWTLQISDIPNAGKNQVSAQNFYESTVVHHHTSVKENIPPKPVSSGDVPPENAQPENAQPEKANPEKANPGETPSKTTAGAEHDVIVISPSGTPQQSATKEASMEDVVDLTMGDDVIPEEAKPEEAKPEQANPEVTKSEDVQMTDAPSDEAAGESKDSFLQFLEDLGYGVVNQYWMKGIRFFQGDIVIEIFKVFIRDDDAPFQESKIKLSLLDESNAFQIKAYISFPKGTSVDLISKRTKDLTNLQATLHNLFELGVPDRMCMDSRVARIN